MEKGSAPVVIKGDSKFDLEQVFASIDRHPWIFAALIGVTILLWVLRPGGFGGKLLDHLKDRAEMKEKVAARRERMLNRWEHLAPPPNNPISNGGSQPRLPRPPDQDAPDGRGEL